MALYWSWNNKCGELIVKSCTEEKEVVKTLYEGNAFLIMLNEWTDEKCGSSMYSMYSFFVDEAHAKNCLGLVKGHTNIFADKITKIRLNKAKSKNWKKIVTLFAQAFDNITIELYTDDTKEDTKDDNNDS